MRMLLRNILGLFIALPLFYGHAWAAGEQSVHALRGAYLYYFSHFIEWPSGSRFDDGVFHLCALSEDTDDRHQLYTINGKAVGDVQLQITLLDENQDVDIKSCHMLYVSGSYSKWLTKNLEKISKDALLVTEGDLKPKGAVHLFIEHQKLKFSIDQDALRDKGFKASSKLLRLSRGRGGND